jgi:S1-C subfamily serine protease
MTLVGALVGGVAGGVVGRQSQQTIVEKFFPTRSSLVQPTTVGAVIAQVLPAVVSVETVSFEEKGSTASGTYVEGAGTGMIITPDGEVLTNNHVVAGASTVNVTLYGQTELRSAKVVGTDPSNDLALLQIEGASNLPTVTFGDSNQSEVGDSVLAVGNALALAGGPSVTEGIISAEGRSLSATDPLTQAPEHLTDLLQTDAAINPGNSGGPLVNSQAQVIGINTAVATSTSGNAPAQDIGFAIAIDTAKPLIPLLRAGGTGPITVPAGGAYLGVSVEDVTPGLVTQDHLSVSSGVLVVSVISGGPGATAGLETNDVITKIGSRSVTNLTDLVNALAADKPGERVPITVERGTRSLVVTVTLGTRPAAVS